MTEHSMKLAGTNRVIRYLDEPPEAREARATKRKKPKADEACVTLLVTDADIAWCRKNRLHKK